MRHFKRMHEQHTVYCGIGKRQLKLVDKPGETRSVTRPLQHSLCGRHKGKTALRLLPKQTEIRRRIADTKHAQTARIGKASANTPAHEPSRDNPEAHSVKIAQVDDIDRHTTTLARTGWLVP